MDANPTPRTILVLIGLLACGASWPALALADPSDAEALNRTMRGLGIKYLVSEDRALPKRDRAKWEEDLSPLVDFASLNAGARRRVREAVETEGVAGLEADDVEALAEKAVLFLVPRRLSDYTIAYLRAQDRVGVFEPCTPASAPREGAAYTVCVEVVSAEELHARFLATDDGAYPTLVFRRTAAHPAWRLSDIDVALTERDLLGLAMWK